MRRAGAIGPFAEQVLEKRNFRRAVAKIHRQRKTECKIPGADQQHKHHFNHGQHLENESLRFLDISQPYVTTAIAS